MSLEVESAHFQKNRRAWAKDHEGEYAVVNGETLHRFYVDLASAYKAGVDAFGAGHFLAKKVTRSDDVEIVRRVYLGQIGST